jgi:predicted ArsR family transcriptional regulator
MSDQDLPRLSPLAEPVRRALYAFVVGQGDAVDRDSAAEGVGIGRPLAAFHLDRLAAAGLLEVEYRRRSGRVGPGAGRPAKFYRRPKGSELTVSLPPRRYDLAAELLARGVEASGPAAARVLEEARERGHALAVAQRDGTGGPDDLIDLLAANGYEPTTESDGTIRLRNCPFHALVTEHRDLTCSMNLALLGSMAAGSGARVEPVADPCEGYCCVAFVPRP